MDDEAENKLPAPLPDFAPVPRLCERHDGWTPERQRLFIEALADYGSVRAACDSVGLATVGAYRLRRQPGAEEFAAAWEAALAHGVRRIEDALMDRALNGVEVPVYSYGKLIGQRTIFNDRLGMFMLRNRLPERFAAGGGARGLNAVDKQTLARLKKQWRKEWEREYWALDQEEEKKTRESIDRFLENMASNREANMSPRTRAAWEEYKRIEAEDKDGAWRLDEIEAEEDERDPPRRDPAQAAPQPTLPAPPEPEQPSGPRIRTIKGDWD